MEKIKISMGLIPSYKWPTWFEILCELWVYPFSTEELELMLNFNGELLIDVSDGCVDGPHSKSPEDMLKSFATQKLNNVKNNIKLS